jgi:hypothetical protein
VVTELRRRRYLSDQAQDLAQEIADTAADPAEVKSELHFLAAALTKK